MKEEIKQAIESLKDLIANLQVISYLSGKTYVEKMEAIAIIERALTDTTLEKLKNEVRTAIERLKSSCGITGKRWQDHNHIDSNISIQDAFATIERALTETTLEIVNETKYAIIEALEDYESGSDFDGYWALEDMKRIIKEAEGK